MKQAYLITAYDNFEHLRELLRFLRHKDTSLYVYVDAKASVPGWMADEDVTVLHDRRVEWGERSQIVTELDLFARAFEDADNEWFHLISGSDFPTRPVEELNSYFERAIDVDCFMESEPLPSRLADRVKFYHLCVVRPAGGRRWK